MPRDVIFLLFRRGSTNTLQKKEYLYYNIVKMFVH